MPRKISKKSENRFKKMTVLRYMDDKTCKTCERTMDIDNFDEGLKTCKMCLSEKKNQFSQT